MRRNAGEKRFPYCSSFSLLRIALALRIPLLFLFSFCIQKKSNAEKCREEKKRRGHYKVEKGSLGFRGSRLGFGFRKEKEEATTR